MLSSNHSRPILLLHADVDEGRALQREIKVLAVDHPILYFPEADHARDYLSAVLVAQHSGEPFRPCLVLYDESMNPVEVAGFRRWSASRAELAEMRFVKLADNPADEAGIAEIPPQIARRPAPAILRELVSRVCPP